MADNYNPETSRTLYNPGSSNQIARLWAREKTLHDLADFGAVDFFEGGGNNPTLLSGFATNKLWLRVEDGVTESCGTVRYYAGGDPTLLASWPEQDRRGFSSHIGARSGVEFDYAWSSATNGDPGTGRVRGNNATLASVTEIAISETGRQGQAYGSRVATWGTNDVVRVYTVGNETEFIDITVTATPTDAGSYYTIPCTVRASSILTAGALVGVGHWPTSPAIDETAAAVVAAAASAADAAASQIAAAEDRAAVANDRTAVTAERVLTQTAADVASAARDIYATEAAGRAAVANGAYFWVEDPLAQNVVALHRRIDAGTVTTPLKRFASDRAVFARMSLPSLPAAVSNFYPCDEGSGTSLRDTVSGATIDTTTGGGTKAWTVRGTLQLTSGWMRTPSITATAMFIVCRSVEGVSLQLLVSPGNRSVSDTLSTFTAIPRARLLSGFGISEPKRRLSNGLTSYSVMSTGGPMMLLADLPGSETGQFVIGAANTSGASPSTFELLALGYCSTVPTDTEARQILNHTRARLAARGIYLTPFDCPTQRRLYVLTGESTHAGTLPLTSVADRNVWSEQMFVRAVNRASANTTGIRMRRCSFRAGSANNNAPDIAANSGPEVGLVSFFNRDTDDGRAADVLKCAQGTTFTAPHASDGNARTLTLATFTGSVSGSTLTVSALASGAVQTGTVIFGTTNYAEFTATSSGTTLTVTAVTSGTIEVGHSPFAATISTQRFITSQLTGTPGGVGTYQLNGSLTVASPTTMQTRMFPLSITAFGTGGGGTGTYTVLNTPGVSIASQTMTATRTIDATVTRTSAGDIPNSQFYTLEINNIVRTEAQARERGIGYTSLVVLEADGINDAFLGTQSVTSSTVVQGWLQDRHDARKLNLGLSQVPTVFLSPHLPANNGTLGSDPDYPNNVVGTDRLTAVQTFRTAVAAFDAANADVVSLDGNNYALNSPSDWVHPSAAGYVAMGEAEGDAARTLLNNYQTLIVPRA